MQSWLNQVELGPLVRSLLDDQEPIIISVFTRISDEIADTSIVAATPAAAQLFGYQTPDELVGRFVSTLHLLEDIKVTRLRSAMRLSDSDVHSREDTYTMRIVRQDGTIQPVVKQVHQVKQGDCEIWVTRHKKTSKNQGPPIPRKKVNAEQLYSCWGSYSVAEANAALRSQKSRSASTSGKKFYLTPDLFHPSIGKIFTNNGIDTHPVTVEEVPSQGSATRFRIEFHDMDTIAIDMNGEPGIYLHQCRQVNCRKQFTSRQGNPQRCKHCGSRIRLKGSD